MNISNVKFLFKINRSVMPDYHAYNKLHLLYQPGDKQLLYILIQKIFAVGASSESFLVVWNCEKMIEQRKYRISDLSCATGSSCKIKISNDIYAV
jgi:hypothetical protein